MEWYNFRFRGKCQASKAYRRVE